MRARGGKYSRSRVFRRRILCESTKGRSSQSIRATHRSRVSSFAADSRGITRHKGSAKYITKLQRAARNSKLVSGARNYVARVVRKCPMQRHSQFHRNMLQAATRPALVTRSKNRENHSKPTATVISYGGLLRCSISFSVVPSLSRIHTTSERVKQRPRVLDDPQQRTVEDR